MNANRILIASVGLALCAGIVCVNVSCRSAPVEADDTGPDPDPELPEPLISSAADGGKGYRLMREAYDSGADGYFAGQTWRHTPDRIKTGEYAARVIVHADGRQRLIVTASVIGDEGRTWWYSTTRPPHTRPRLSAAVAASALVAHVRNTVALK